MAETFKKETLFGIGFDALTMERLIEKIDGDLRDSKRLTLAFSNPEFVLEARKNTALREYLNSANYNLADGVGIVAASRVLGQPLPERVTGTDFIYRIAEFCVRNSHTLFLFGGKPGVADEAKKRLEDLYPGLQIVGAVHGYVENMDKVVEAVNQAKPTFLMVCLGNPIQEQWISRHRDELDAKVVFGNGGALDFCAGRVRRAPRWVRKLWLEWLYRLRSDFTLKRVKRQARLSSYAVWVMQQVALRLIGRSRG